MGYPYPNFCLCAFWGGPMNSYIKQHSMGSFDMFALERTSNPNYPISQGPLMKSSGRKGPWLKERTLKVQRISRFL